MNKGRIEAFSDSVFAVAMTLLVVGIKIPVIPGATEAQVGQIFAQISPLIVLYMASFFVLSITWTNHHFIFHAFAKEVNRQLNMMNMAYLMFV
ncbi:MAG TPA: TMEM175 family protein, partial [Candidatus Paceibacterota bacterium]|nr:TMEM175 family protein [Candidatus Paceibacterota bacterium]